MESCRARPFANCRARHRAACRHRENGQAERRIPGHIPRVSRTTSDSRRSRSRPWSATPRDWLRANVSTLDTALIMAADTISGYIQGLLDGVEFKQTAYALDRDSRKAATSSARPPATNMRSSKKSGVSRPDCQAKNDALRESAGFSRAIRSPKRVRLTSEVPGSTLRRHLRQAIKLRPARCRQLARGHTPYCGTVRGRSLWPDTSAPVEALIAPRGL